MSKRFKGKTCVYCTIEGIADTGDHVFAREFLPVEQRSNISQVPACNPCNGEKAALEHYLTAVLPFGGRHADAMENLETAVPPRLAKNQKLHRSLAKDQSRVWTREKSGLLVPSLTVPIDSNKLERLISFITRGLMWHHWNVVLGPDCFVDVHSLTGHCERVFHSFNKMQVKDRVANDIGAGAFVYKGIQGVDNPAVSIWELSIYGGMKMASADGKDLMSKFGVMTGPKRIQDRATELSTPTGLHRSLVPSVE